MPDDCRCGAYCQNQRYVRPQPSFRSSHGRAEVVVSGENHGLKVVELSSLDLDALKP